MFGELQYHYNLEYYVANKNGVFKEHLIIREN
jgi:hypothetical protein